MLCESYMSRHLIKRAVVTVVSFVLLYYSVAGALLRCFHDVDDLNDESEICYQNTGHDNLECVGPEYHTESMAGSSAPPQLHRIITDCAPHANNILILRNFSEEISIWRRAVFRRLSPLKSLNPVPRYLSLSVLRI